TRAGAGPAELPQTSGPRLVAARASWKSAGPNQLRFDPLALTRALCLSGSLHDRIAKDWEFVRSYTIKDDHLFQALMVDGGVYEFEATVAAKVGGCCKTFSESFHWAQDGEDFISSKFAPFMLRHSKHSYFLW